MTKPTTRAYSIFAAFALIYIALTLGLPADATTLTRYNISASQARNINLTVVIPYIIIWFIAFFGYIRLKKYSTIVRRSSEGKALSRIADGLLVLAAGLPIAAILGKALGYVGSTHPNLLPATTITSLYIDILIGILGMGAIFKGSQKLVNIVDENIKKRPAHLTMIALTIISTSFIYLTLNNPARQFPTVEAGRAAYYMADFFLVTTVILPYLIIWYMGLHSAYYIQIYRRDVKGIVYRSALGYVASGVVFIVLARIATRYLTSLNTILSSWTLSYLLIVIYCLLILIAVGFVLIARGASKLKRIEEV